jgi:hypothetical protein
MPIKEVDSNAAMIRLGVHPRLAASLIIAAVHYDVR